MSELHSTSDDAILHSVHDEFVDQVKSELSEIDASDLSEHAARFELLHGKLQQALTSIDGL